MQEENLVTGMWVKRSSYRFKILKTLLENNVMTPKMISDKTEIQIYHISNILRQLKEKGLIVCLNEEEHRGRLYKITNNGQDVMEAIKLLE